MAELQVPHEAARRASLLARREFEPVTENRTHPIEHVAENRIENIEISAAVPALVMITADLCVN